MIAEIEAAKADGDTLGGVVEVVANGLPVGLGSFTSGDNRLDSQLAGAVMGIQAIKGVEIGDGFETARRRGSVAHDEMYPGPGGVMRSTNRAGGLEGGMTNGQPLRVRAAMKPISTVPRALATVDMATGDEAVAIHQRSDVCAVPAAGRGGRDHGRAGAGPRGAGEVRRRLVDRDPRQPRHLSARRGRPRAGSTARRRRADGAQGGTDRNARVGQVHDRSAAGQVARRRAAGHRRGDRADHRPHHPRYLQQRRREGVPPHRGASRSRTHWRRTTACCRSAAAPSPAPVCAKHFPDTPLSTSRSAPRRGCAAPAAPRCGRCWPAAIAAEKFRALMSQRVPLYRRAATIRVNTNRRNPGAVVRYIVSRLENPRADDAPPKPRRKRRPSWRRSPVSLTPSPSEPTTPASPAELARRAEARHD